MSTACTPGLGLSSTTDLSFQGMSFGQPSGITTTNGNLTVTLGQFTLSDPTTTLIDTDFYSTITFTLPVTIDGGRSTSAFTAEVLGIVKRDQFGAVLIDFDTSKQHFTFANSNYTGSFDFNVDTLLFGDIGAGSKTVTWNGEVTNAVQTYSGTPVPEPASMMLTSLGLLSIFLVRRASTGRN